MKLLIKTALATTALLAAATCATAQTTLFYGEAGPNRGVRAEGTKWFVDEVERLSEGDVTIDVNWGGALFSEKAAVQSIRDGVADLGSVIGVYFPQDMVAYGLADLPIPNDDAWVGMKATDRIMRTDPQVQKNLADQNLVYIGTYTTSAVQVGCKGKSIKSLDDLAGLKVRGVGAYGKVFNDLGATPVDMSVYEAYQGLETGLIDCTQTYPYLVKALKFDEVFDSYTELDWGQIGALGIMMNKDSFDALPPEDQQAIMTAGEGLADEFGRILTAANEESVQILRNQGKEVTKISDTDRQTLIEASQPYIAEWIDRADAAGLDGAAMVEEYKSLIDQYAQQRDEQGYPWAPKN
ncbi:putative dicarboxylate-binding periplasmic protein [Oceaniovalibus guishaninsula JLT2003]|uniref:Putative dicarboxylate-binding periplasmic protein n=1 Tax=Oceaniovalibus guishaninsula JLT2003 TaxID=1231392 RepID=K2HG83_9RHOB|nr:C4-dicarboxylate TRAP transporter substrate-binding protein [Oceaniovalibus guishaninsula]EKE45472.1 putative dicarboxylate-binding periplasmic protein [Oceaniovalibus guishaninsula JLT2003]